MESQNKEKAEILRSLSYDPETGYVTWAISKKGAKQDVEIKTKDKDGYLLVGVNYKLYRLHRVVWLIHYGEWPSGCIDHINGVRDDNRIENLRCVTVAENSKNQKKNIKNKSGVVGVILERKSNKWAAYITISRKNIWLGTFSNIFDAAACRISAQNKAGFHANHGRGSK